jgi:hypothetical protein
VLIQLVDRALRAWGYRTTVDRMARLSPSPGPLPAHAAPAAAERAWRLVQPVNVAAKRRGEEAFCLRRSVAGWWILRWAGIPAEICVGVRREGDKLEAHAWLEHGALVINDYEDVPQRYPVRFSLDGLEVGQLLDSGGVGGSGHADGSSGAEPRGDGPRSPASDE